MNVLIASATSYELPSIPSFMEGITSKGTEKFGMLVTGIGSMAATYALTNAVKADKPDLIIQAGIAGSYDQNYPPGSIVIVGTEVIADLGAEEGGALKSLFDLKLVSPDDRPFTQGRLVNSSSFPGKLPEISTVHGATVNAISSSKEQAERIRHKYNVVVESMEGAALHFVCLQENIPFLQLRSISNFAGERDKTRWNMKGAITLLNDQLMRILSSF